MSFCVLGAIGIFLYVFSIKSGTPNIIREKKQSDAIYPVIMPHFDTFKKERQSFLKNLASEVNPKKIILLSVDHYNAGKKNISSTNRSWKLKDGDIDLEKDIFNKLVGKSINDDEGAFSNEHGIKNVIPDLVSYFPSAQILPILVKDGTSNNEIDNLYQGLIDNCGNDCLIVGSVDFSHNNPNSIAKIHDQFSINALNGLSEEKIKKAETDSPDILAILTRIAKFQNAQSFKLAFNSNSAEKSGDDSIEATSVVIGQFQKEKIESKATTLMFGGDLMTDRLIYHKFKNNLIEAFDKIGARVFWGTDSSIINNEGPVSSEPINDDITANNLVFNFPRSTIDALKYLHIDAVSLANNHSFNAGKEGFSVTEQLFNEAGIKHFGNQNTFDEGSILNIESDFPVSVFGVNLLSVSDIEPLKASIKTAKEKGRFVIVFPHWGNEYQKVHSSAQRQVASELTDAGADAIIGSHPHVVQDFEIINGKPVVYSLGNFIFDQTFSKPTMEGLVVGLTIKPDSIEIAFFPTKQINLKPQLMRYEEKNSKIQEIFDINAGSGFIKLRSDTISISR